MAGEIVNLPVTPRPGAEPLPQIVEALGDAYRRVFQGDAFILDDTLRLISVTLQPASDQAPTPVPQPSVVREVVSLRPKRRRAAELRKALKGTK